VTPPSPRDSSHLERDAIFCRRRESKSAVVENGAATEEGRGRSTLKAEAEKARKDRVVNLIIVCAFVVREQIGKPSRLCLLLTCLCLQPTDALSDLPS